MARAGNLKTRQFAAGQFAAVVSAGILDGMKAIFDMEYSYSHPIHIDHPTAAGREFRQRRYWSPGVHQNSPNSRRADSLIRL